MPVIRRLGVAGLAAVLASSLPAQSPELALSFLGLEPGMHHPAADSAMARHGGTLQCQPTREPRITACRGRLRVSGEVLSTSISLVDDRVAIALISARLPAARIADWHAELVDRYGEAPASRRAGQESFQWIRSGRMLRLTVRREQGGLTASVSLLDGRLLDSLPPP